MRLAIVAVVVAFASCKATTTAQSNVAEPSLQVYKTKADYSNNVPVILSDDKTQIVSYPAPADLKNANGYTSPSALHNGYLLDNTGIGANVAFLRLTYEEYAAMESAPALQEMYNMIIDKDPLTELYDCGSRKNYTDTEKDLNTVIDHGKLKKQCKRIK